MDRRYCSFVGGIACCVSDGAVAGVGGEGKDSHGLKNF